MLSEEYYKEILKYRDYIYSLSGSKRYNFEMKSFDIDYESGEEVLLAYGGSGLNCRLGKIYIVEPWRRPSVSNKWISERTHIRIRNDEDSLIFISKFQVQKLNYLYLRLTTSKLKQEILNEQE